MLAMRKRSEQLELEEREARAAIRGAEILSVALRQAFRDVKRLRLEGQFAEMSDVELAQKLVTLAAERTIGRLENERSDAAERIERAPTERNLTPVCAPSNENGVAL